MDPLSVTASIVGILAAAGKVIEILSPIISGVKDAQPRARTAYAEVRSCVYILSALQTLFLDSSGIISRKRKELIQLDHLIATFTDGVLLFSDLEDLVVRIGPATDTIGWQIKWAYHEKEFDSLLSRMLYFKSSMTLMLNILKCESDVEAVRHHRDVSSVLASILKNNQDVERRLANIEQSLLRDHTPGDRQSTTGSTITGLLEPQTGESNALEQNLGDNRHSASTITMSIRNFSFEKDLEVSRPYRKAIRDTMDFSFRSSLIGSKSWSTLSDLSLSEISNISVIALPICSSDITNSSHYRFGLEISPSQDLKKVVLPTVLGAADYSRPGSPDSLAPPCPIPPIPPKSPYRRFPILPVLPLTPTNSSQRLLPVLPPMLPTSPDLVLPRFPSIPILSPPLDLSSPYSSSEQHIFIPDFHEPFPSTITDAHNNSHACRSIAIKPIAYAAVSTRTQSASSPTSSPESAVPPWKPSVISRDLFGFQREYNLVLLGDFGSGKTALANQFIHSIFDDVYDPFIEQPMSKICTIDKEHTLLRILDAASQEVYPALSQQEIRTGEGFMLVFSVTSRHQFDRILPFQSQIRQVKDKDHFPMIIVGTNCSQISARQVGYEEGMRLALKLGCAYVETDAKDCINVGGAFHGIVREIRRHNIEKSQQETRNIIDLLKKAESRRGRNFWKKARTGQSDLDKIEET